VQTDLNNGELVVMDLPMGPKTNFALYRLRSRKMPEQAMAVMKLVKNIFAHDF